MHNQEARRPGEYPGWVDAYERVPLNGDMKEQAKYRNSRSSCEDCRNSRSSMYDFILCFFSKAIFAKNSAQCALIYATLPSFFHFFGYFLPIFALSWVFVCEFLLLM